MKVLVIVGHPRPASFCAALAAAYAEGAALAGAEVERLDLSQLVFDPDVHPVSPRDQPLEPDLERARAAIARADHLVFVHPGWWGVGPARLRGLLDRVLLPGFAFRERPDGRYEGLLGPRTAHLVMTLDMPPWVYRLVYRAPGVAAMKRSALGFCGVETTRVALLGPVKGADAARCAGWLDRVRALGLSLRDGPRSRPARAARTALAWLAALRLQFYPMSWMAYSVGALVATRTAAAAAGPIALPWDRAAYWVGYAFLFCVEAATVLANEWFDRASDRLNANHGPFNGGSRVLVDARIGAAAWRRGIGLALLGALACAVWLVGRRAGLAAVPEGAVPVALAALAALGLGYTVPPLRLCWRGWGEIDVALTHGAGVVLAGHLLQGGAWNDPLPWLVSLPIGLAVLPAIVLSGVPDAAADRAAGKRTLAVRLGTARAGWLVFALVPLAPLAVALLGTHAGVARAYAGVTAFALPHAALLMAVLWRRLRAGLRCERIDGPMVVALSYIVWFAAWPLWRLG